jgi:hypothetical protein
LIPIHEKLCVGGVVDKTKLFFQLLANASPAVSDQLKFAVGGDWHKLVADKNICPQFGGCSPKDAQAIESIHLNYTVFVSDGDREGYYHATNPNLTIGQYFNSPQSVGQILCTAKDEAPAPPAPEALEINSPIRIRGVSDDLWIDQKSPLFAKSSSAGINYSQDDSKFGAHTNKTTITGAIGYAIPLGDNPAFTQEITPFVAGNTSVTNTQNKPTVAAPTNFVAGGVLYDAQIQESWGFHQIMLKPQFTEGTSMQSQLTSLQVIYAPWTDAAVSAPFLPLNTVVNFIPGSDIFPNINGQVLFDLRADVGHYIDRGAPPYVSQNQDFERIGTKFGFALIGTPSTLPTFALNITETALYGASGAYRKLSYFDSLLSIYFDPKRYFSATFEYFNGRDENTYVLTRGVKAGLAAHF